MMVLNRGLYKFSFRFHLKVLAGFVRALEVSSIEPKLFSSLPEIVPEAYKSPTSTLQPLMV